MHRWFLSKRTEDYIQKHRKGQSFPSSASRFKVPVDVDSHAWRGRRAGLTTSQGMAHTTQWPQLHLALDYRGSNQVNPWSQGPKKYILNALRLSYWQKCALKSHKMVIALWYNMPSSSTLCLWIFCRTCGLGVLRAGHADYNSPIYKSFLHPPSLPQFLPVSLFSCTHRDSGKVVLTTQSSSSWRTQSLSKLDSYEAQAMVSTAIPPVPIGNW
jgi:hypothetical protein